MADTAQDYERLARQMQTMELRQHTTAALPQDICATWKVVEPFVETGMQILRMLPFAWAGKLADALKLLAEALRTFCKP